MFIRTYNHRGFVLDLFPGFQGLFSRSPGNLYREGLLCFCLNHVDLKELQVDVLAYWRWFGIHIPTFTRGDLSAWLGIKLQNS